MKPKNAKTAARDKAAAERQAREDRERLAGSPTAAAEHMIDERKHAGMGAEEKLQERIDDLMRRTP